MKEIRCPKCGSVFSVDDADYAAIVSQVRNAEFDDEMQRRTKDIYERYKAALKLAESQKDNEFQSKINNKDAEIDNLKNKLANIEVQKNGELKSALAAKDIEIAKLNSTIAQNAKER